MLSEYSIHSPLTIKNSIWKSCLLKMMSSRESRCEGSGSFLTCCDNDEGGGGFSRALTQLFKILTYAQQVTRTRLFYITFSTWSWAWTYKSLFSHPLNKWFHSSLLRRQINKLWDVWNWVDLAHADSFPRKEGDHNFFCVKQDIPQHSGSKTQLVFPLSFNQLRRRIPQLPQESFRCGYFIAARY